MKKRIVFLLASTIVYFTSTMFTFGQVEHNYSIVSGYTNCDSLDLKDIEKKEVLKLLEQASFRFRQEFKLTRQEGLKGAAYYSCDGERGYLAVFYHDHSYLFKNVTKEIWVGFSKSSDPEGFFTKQILSKVPLYE